jgi:hypothetical protein
MQIGCSYLLKNHITAIKATSYFLLLVEIKTTLVLSSSPEYSGESVARHGSPKMQTHLHRRVEKRIIERVQSIMVCTNGK